MGRTLGDETDATLSNHKGRENQHCHQQHPQEKSLSSSRLDIELKLAWDRGSAQSAALKIIRTDPVAFNDHPCSQLVEYEIKAMDRVASHHNVMRLITVRVRSPSNICLVMEAAAACRGNLMETITAAPEGR